MKDRRWSLVRRRRGGDQHVLPIGDTHAHTELLQCLCRPYVETQPNGTRIVVHNSYDGREYLEPAGPGPGVPVAT